MDEDREHRMKREFLERIFSPEKFGCIACGHQVMPYYAYCGKCGIKNPNFNEDVFKEEVGMTLAEAQEKVCENSHALLKNDMAKDAEIREAVSAYPYCEDCGEWIL